MKCLGLNQIFFYFFLLNLFNVLPFYYLDSYYIISLCNFIAIIFNTSMRRSTDRAARIAEKTNSLNKNFRIKTKPMSNNILRNSELISGQASYQLTPIQSKTCNYLDNSAMQQNRNQ